MATGGKPDQGLARQGGGYEPHNKHSSYSTDRQIPYELFLNWNVLNSVSDPYQLNPDPAKNINPDPDPSYFLINTFTSGKN